jgi:flavin-dependent dehydrogenase
LHYDVTVIGAGPGGCMAARVLGGAGFKVLLVEKEKLPREKPCGGFISPEAVDLIEEYFSPLPEDCLAAPSEVHGARLVCQGGGAYDLPFSGPGRSVLRSRLDAWLAATCGAEVKDGCEVVDFDVKRFHVSVRAKDDAGETEIESTYLIGADGADSLVLRNLRPEFHRVYAAPGLQRTMLVLVGGEVDWNPQWIGMVLLKEGIGLGRFFVKGDLIGLAVNYDSQGGWQGELGALTTFLKRTVGLRPQDEAIRMITSSNRMGARGSYNLGAGCALLAGEAAGILDPWGFGIFPALESGRVAAESLVESAGESITPHIRYRYRLQEWLELDQKQRRKLSGKVGCLEVASLAEDRSRTARRDRRMLHRRLSK